VEEAHSGEDELPTVRQRTCGVGGAAKLPARGLISLVASGWMVAARTPTGAPMPVYSLIPSCNAPRILH
jgi:hypothetical protein